MDKFDKETTLVNLDNYINKADYLSESIIERYNLGEGMVKNQKEAMSFANSRENIGMEMEILCDYIHNIRETLSALREVVMV